MDLQHMENGLGGGGGGGGGGISGGGGLSEIEFQRLSQIITTSIEKIQRNVSTMQRMVNQRNTPQDSPELKKQLHQLMTYTQQLVTDTNSQINEVDKCKERHLKILRDRLVDEFTAALTAFQSIQRKTADIEKNALRQARAQNYSISHPSGGSISSSARNNSNSNSHNASSNNGFEDNFVNHKSGQQSQQQQQIQTQMQEQVDLQAIEEQEQAIRVLENNIVGVNEIYKKLGAMVYDQAVTIDSIESQVEQTSVFVSQGTENLRKASSYKNKVRKKKLILIGILSFVLLFIILILVFQFKN